MASRAFFSYNYIILYELSVILQLVREYLCVAVGSRMFSKGIIPLPPERWYDDRFLTIKIKISSDSRALKDHLRLFNRMVKHLHGVKRKHS
ncbi:hypothetical protein D3OALGB2SA_5794 [Olavius algarvensis associated proteobacterium Delta 3]|nr:hypothetical protein D3OALGB2SA_5794 [Olavius algarvensis associated proteobacterium Delta 3]